MVKTVPPRSAIPLEMTWNLETIFATDAGWEEQFTFVGQHLPTLRALQGSLHPSAHGLLQALHLRDQTGEVLGRLVAYATMRFHEDTTRVHYQALSDRVMALAAEFGMATAFFVPEILAIPADRLESYFAAEPDLALYRHQLDEITRKRPHVRSAEVEHTLASFSEVAQGPYRTYEVFQNADLPLLLPVIHDEAGNEVQLTDGNYDLFMRSENRTVRQVAFDGLHETYKQFQNLLATNFSNQVKKNLLYTRERQYDSALAAALDDYTIPTSVYTTLIQTVNANLPALHRYLALRQHILHLDGGQHIYDLYAPLVAEATGEISFEEAREKVVQAMGPLGQEYTTALERGMRSRWIDVYENQGKLSGAYSGGSYGTPPFVLLNYQGQLQDMFTLAHEMGHAMHSYFTRATQPYPYGDGFGFQSEIVSTLNEALLTHYLLQTTTDKAVRASVINHYLDGFRTTLFRQTLFADFELQAHQHAETGVALTPDLLCGIYKTLNDRYYGAGGVVVDDLVAWEWSRIPHFYFSFYVYAYATGISASAALVRQIISEGQPAVDRYLRLLRSGFSEYPMDLLREALVDMRTPAPVEAAIAEFDRYVGEMETLLG